MNQIDSINQQQSQIRFWLLRIPLTLQIVIALILAVILGIALGAGNPIPANRDFIETLAIPAKLVLKTLRTLATPLILMAVLHTFLTTDIPKKTGIRLAGLLLTNTTVAILIGLFVANVGRPGNWGSIVAPGSVEMSKQTFDPWVLLQDAIPPDILSPLVDNNVIQLIVIALTFGIVLRKIKSEQIAQGKTGYITIEQAINTLFEAIIRILHWVIALVPLAVFGIVAQTIAEKGFEPFKTLSAFVIAVLVALSLQVCYYLIIIKFGSWVKPLEFLREGSDAFLTAFSTASSVAAMPITFDILQQKIGLRESSASLGALVGSNFNNDGTALYEAMSALFISQVLGQNLDLGQQFIVVLTAIFASVGAAGIPEAGLVTMTLVFTSVGLPTEYIALLVTVDWFLDRCRTAITVMGDMTVSVVLDGKKPDAPSLRQQ